jgi:hypothetical protein
MGEFEPKKSNVFPIACYVANAVSAQTDVEMSIAGEATAGDVPQQPIPWAGSIVGASLQCEAVVTAGTGTVYPTINGVTAASSLVLDAVTNTQYTAASWNRGLYPVTANQRIGAQYTTTGTFTAGDTRSLMMYVFVHVEEN